MKITYTSWTEEISPLLDEIYQAVFKGLYNDSRVPLIESALITIAEDAAVRKIISQEAALLVDVLKACRSDNFPPTSDVPEEREMALVELYLCLHAAGPGYSVEEEVLLAERIGVRCLPGGMMPLLLASRLIGPDSVFADLGAGNGLQGLLLQQLCPHRQTLQVELSAGMIDVGKKYQQALQIAPEKIIWQHGNIVDADLSGIDLVYLYRPARPMDQGNDLYRIIADKLAARKEPVIIVSLADCLARFLPDRFSVVYKNEFINIFKG